MFGKIITKSLSQEIDTDYFTVETMLGVTTV